MPRNPTELPTAIFPAMLRKGCGEMAMDNSPQLGINGEESERPTLSSCSKKGAPFMNRKTGQFTCYKTGHFYLLLTLASFILDKSSKII